MEFYDSNTGKLLFTAPKSRTMEAFLVESRRHGECGARCRLQVLQTMVNRMAHLYIVSILLLLLPCHGSGWPRYVRSLMLLLVVTS